MTEPVPCVSEWSKMFVCLLFVAVAGGTPLLLEYSDYYYDLYYGDYDNYDAPTENYSSQLCQPAEIAHILSLVKPRIDIFSCPEQL